MKKYKKIGSTFFCLAIVAGIVFLWFLNRKLSFTRDWIYCYIGVTEGDIDESGKERVPGVWRVHKKTGKQELIYEEEFYSSILETEDKIYVQIPLQGIYQMEPDGNNKTLIYEGMVNANSLQQEEDWLYFSLMTDSRIPIEEQKNYWRFHMKTGELESFLPYERTETLVMFSSFVVAGKYFYTIAEKDGKRGILSYRLDSGEKQFCEKLNMEEVGGIGIKSLMLEECGDYLVLLYLDYLGAGNTASMYATKKGEAISEETEWKEIRFPDMLERTASPPTPVLSII